MNMFGSQKVEFLVNFEQTDAFEAYLSELGLLYSYTTAHKANDTGVAYRVWTVRIPKRGFDPIHQCVQNILQGLR